MNYLALNCPLGEVIYGCTWRSGPFHARAFSLCVLEVLGAVGRERSWLGSGNVTKRFLEGQWGAVSWEVTAWHWQGGVPGAKEEDEESAWQGGGGGGWRGQSVNRAWECCRGALQARLRC